jgi:tetratricopeptide (TPR) repeat protein
MPHRSFVSAAACFALVTSLILPLDVFAVGSGPAPAPVTPRSADAEYNQGLRNKAAKRFSEAAVDFRRAVDLRQNFPEAWNELGFALRQTGKYGDAITAYDQALRLRPNFPEALEYLGEAYVKLGRLDDARGLLERLRTLDLERARELDAAIQAGK